ncbi:unnamed protein product [Urochloa humidicola]
MAIPVARVHLAMVHAALPGLLPSPPKCAMLALLPAPPCAAIILPDSNSPPRPSRADAAERWDAHKIKPAGSPASPSPSSSGSHCALESKSSSPGCASFSSEKWVSKNKKSAGAGAATSSSSSSSSSCSDSEERWDARKKPASPASSSSSSSPASRSKRRGGGSKRRPNSRASSAERWDAHKNGRRAPRADGFINDGGSSTGSNDMQEVDMGVVMPRALYAGPGFMASSPEPSMLPMPSFMIRVA